jgi:hypothetical protein
MDDDEHRRAQIGGKLADQSAQSLNASGGSGDDDDVSRLLIHGGPLLF